MNRIKKLITTLILAAILGVSANPLYAFATETIIETDAASNTESTNHSIGHPTVTGRYTYILGDANSDGILDKKDYILIKRISFGTAAALNGVTGSSVSSNNGYSETLWMHTYIYGDANQDGVLDKKDYTEVKRMILNDITKYVYVNNGDVIVY